MIPVRRLVLALIAAGLPAVGPASAADLRGDPEGFPRTGRFRAACEDLGQFCFADACGGNQIDAALNCRALCPSSVILEVVPGSCPLPPDTRVRVRLRSRG